MLNDWFSFRGLVTTVIATMLITAGTIRPSGAQVKQDTSKTNVKLRKYLKQYPDADTNKDGELTRAEGLAHYNKNKSKTPAKVGKAPARTTKTPAKAGRAPVRTTKTPAKVGRAPAKTAKAPPLSARVRAQLKRYLKDHPEADTNKDRVLTLEEGNAHYNKSKSKTPANTRRAPARAAISKARAGRPAVVNRNVPTVQSVRQSTVHYWKKILDKTHEHKFRIEEAKLRGKVSLLIQRQPFTQNPENIKEIEKYFKEYFFTKLCDRKYLSNMPEKVRHKFRIDLVNTKSKEAYELLVKIAKEELDGYIKGIKGSERRNYSPVTRYNAMLILGDLNTTRPTKRNPEIVPLQTALPLMRNVVSEPKQHFDAVKIAALIGILRHAKSGKIPSKNKELVIQTMLELVGTSAPPPGRSPEGHYWMQLRAIEVLGALGDLGIQCNVALALEKVVGQKAAPIWLRCGAARSLGQLHYKKKDRRGDDQLLDETKMLNPLRMANTLRALGAEACRRGGEELARASEEVARGSVVPNQAILDRANEKLLIARAQVLHDWNCVYDAFSGSPKQLGGLLALASKGTHEIAVTEIGKRMLKLKASLQNQKDVGRQLGDKITKAIADLETDKAAAVQEAPAEGEPEAAGEKTKTKTEEPEEFGRETKESEDGAEQFGQ